jgi:polyferredoxin
VDLLRLPVIGAVLRWRHLRHALQLTLLAMAAVVVAHGLLGPQIGPRNLATVTTSIHWRGLLVIGLLVAGNVFCTACPMVLARDAGRHVFHARLRWPRALRGKWLGIALLVGVLYSYELFDLWSNPAATAWIILGYFGAALIVDMLFSGAAFCKHLCPIGQFNFIASTVSPTELRVVDRDTCRGCRTVDCIKGRRDPLMPARILQRGCELALFLPAKVGNLDCTLCLDCVRACPHDNIALAVRPPGAELLHTARRSGIGTLAHRPDLAALALVFVAASLVAAFAMTAPATALEQGIAGMLGTSSEGPALAVVFTAGLLILPAAFVAAATSMTRATRPHPFESFRNTAARHAMALVPFGFGVWVAHYAFHVLTGALTLLPVAQAAAIDALGWPALGEPAWSWVGLQPGVVLPLQIGLVIVGASGSIGLLRAMERDAAVPGASRGSVPWMALVAVLAVVAVWTFAQPMEMRGVGRFG